MSVSKARPRTTASTGADTGPSPARTLQTPGTATDRVTASLRDAILTLELAPGALLDRADLTRRFAVSRFPVAEAFNRLKTEGLVEIRPQSGTRVARIRLADMRENMFLRRALEGEAVAGLAATAQSSQIAALRTNLLDQAQAMEAGDRVRFYQLDLAFHEIIVGDIGYPRIRATVEAARLALDRVRRLLATPRRHAVTLAEHEAIVEAIAAGRPLEARAAMAAHVDSVVAELEALVLRRPDIFIDVAAGVESKY